MFFDKDMPHFGLKSFHSESNFFANISVFAEDIYLKVVVVTYYQKEDSTPIGQVCLSACHPDPDPQWGN